MADIVVTSIPRTDTAFRTHLDAALGRVADLTPARLQAELRKAYPKATVQAGDPLGALGARPRWYAYRDGGSSSTTDSGWWGDARLATTILGADGRYLDANSAAAELFGVPIAEIVGAAAGSFTRHEDDPEMASRLLEALRRTGELASTAVVVRPDGDEIPIEFHMAALAPAGTFITVMRRLEAAEVNRRAPRAAERAR